MYKAPAGHVVSKNSGKSAMQACGVPSIPEALLQNFGGRNVGLRPGTHFYRGQTGQYVSLRASYQRLSRLPSGVRSSSGYGWAGLSGDVAFLKLSKLLNQEDA
jgi:hypothetical protein